MHWTQKGRKSCCKGCSLAKRNYSDAAGFWEGCGHLQMAQLPSLHQERAVGEGFSMFLRSLTPLLGLWEIKSASLLYIPKLLGCFQIYFLQGLMANYVPSNCTRGDHFILAQMLLDSHNFLSAVIWCQQHVEPCHTERELSNLPRTTMHRLMTLESRALGYNLLHAMQTLSMLLPVYRSFIPWAAKRLQSARQGKADKPKCTVWTPSLMS